MVALIIASSKILVCIVEELKLFTHVSRETIVNSGWTSACTRIRCNPVACVGIVSKEINFVHARASSIIPFRGWFVGSKIFSVYYLYYCHTNARSVSPTDKHAACFSTWRNVPRDPPAIHPFSLRKELYFTIVAPIWWRKRERMRQNKRDKIFVSCLRWIVSITLILFDCTSNCNGRKMDQEKKRKRENMHACVSERTSKWENTACVNACSCSETELRRLINEIL